MAVLLAVLVASMAFAGVSTMAPPVAQAASVQWVPTSGSWYLYIDGVRQYGWKKVDAYWYYLSPSTGLVLFGWQKIDGDWYYLIPDANSGRAAMGWMTIGGARFYFNPAGESGRMLMGWQKIDGYWYYFEPAGESGRMVTGWQKIGTTWFYLDGSGHQLFDWVWVNGYWYYLSRGPSGEWGGMLTGWQDLPDRGSYYRFYFAPGDAGWMLTGDQTVGGVRERFGAAGGPNEGHWLNYCTSTGQASRTFSVQYDVNSTWNAYFDTARARWNSAGVGANITYSSTAASHMVVDFTSVEDIMNANNGVLAYGVYEYNSKSGTFTIRVFTESLWHSLGTSTNPAWGSWAMGTATHELGHALRLIDNPTPTVLGTYNTSSLMSYDRNRSTLGSPTGYDQENVRRCFA
jgi:hypothetical protein